MDKQDKTLVVIMGKGGVGKSLLSRMLMYYAQQENLPIVAFDADASNASLARFYPEATVVDVDGDLPTTHWYEMNVVPPLLEPGKRLVLLDLGAGSERLFLRWCVENRAPEVLQEQGTELILWHVMDPTLDAVSPFLDAVNSLPKVRQVVWFNHGLAKGLDVVDPDKAFAAIRREPEFVEAIVGRQQRTIPNLQASREIDVRDLPFDLAASGTESPLHLFERIRVYHWLQAMSAEIAEAL